MNFSPSRMLSVFSSVSLMACVAEPIRPDPTPTPTQICADGLPPPPTPRLIEARGTAIGNAITFSNLDTPSFRVFSREITPGHTEGTRSYFATWDSETSFTPYATPSLSGRFTFYDIGYPPRPLVLGGLYEYQIYPLRGEDCIGEGLIVTVQTGGTYQESRPTYSGVSGDHASGEAICVEAPEGRQFLHSQDQDCDGVLNTEDNCDSRSNPNQLDRDQDGIGDACETPECIDTPNPPTPGQTRVIFYRGHSFDDRGNRLPQISAEAIWYPSFSPAAPGFRLSADYYDASGNLVTSFTPQGTLYAIDPDPTVNWFQGGRVVYTVQNSDGVCLSKPVSVSATIPTIDHTPTPSPIEFIEGNFNFDARTLFLTLRHVDSHVNVTGFHIYYAPGYGSARTCTTNPESPSHPFNFTSYRADNGDYLLTGPLLEYCPIISGDGTAVAVVFVSATVTFPDTEQEDYVSGPLSLTVYATGRVSY